VIEEKLLKNLYEKLGFKPTGEAYLLRNRLYLKMEYIPE
jgi:hypothetical protein